MLRLIEGELGQVILEFSKTSPELHQVVTAAAELAGIKNGVLLPIYPENPKSGLDLMLSISDSKDPNYFVKAGELGSQKFMIVSAWSFHERRAITVEAIEGLIDRNHSGLEKIRQKFVLHHQSSERMMG